MMSGVMVRQEGYDLPIADNGMYVRITLGMIPDENITPIPSTESE